MTKKLSELFELPEDIAPQRESDQVQAIEQVTTQAYSNLEKIESALPQVRGLEASDTEMDELAQLKRLAGVNEYKGLQPYDINEGSNISITGNEKGQLMKKHDIRPGTQEWFKLWFSLPYMTGERPIGDDK